MPLDVLDAASVTETGLDTKVNISALQINKSCQSTTGSVHLSAMYPGAGILSYTLDNAITNTTGLFANVTEGRHTIRTAVVGGSCSTDTVFTIAASYRLINGIVKTSPDNCLNTSGSVQINASSVNGAITYTLLNSNLTQSTGEFSNLRGGRYDFRIADASGCSKDTSVIITENASLGCNDILIPNAFTPNRDGKNDVFSFYAPASFKDISMQVFNRWGNIVYERKGNNFAWDGTFKGSNQPADVYVYIISYTDAAGNRKNAKGPVTLIR
jgi:gliding motility-associated-like protein